MLFADDAVAPDRDDLAGTAIRLNACRGMPVDQPTMQDRRMSESVSNRLEHTPSYIVPWQYSSDQTKLVKARVSPCDGDRGRDVAARRPRYLRTQITRTTDDIAS